MRAERLAWAEKPAVKVDVERRQAPAMSARASRRRLLHRSGVRVLARVADGLAISLATIGLCISAGIDLWNASFATALPFITLPPMCVAAAWLAGGYRFQYAGSIAAHLARVSVGVGAAMGAVFLVALLANADSVLFGRLAAADALAMFGLHANYLAIVRTATRRGYLSDSVVIVGATQAAAHIVSRNVQERELNILGYFDDRAGRTASTLMGDAPFLGGVDDLLAWNRLPEADCIIVTVTSTAQERVRSLIDRMRNLPQEIILVLDLDGFAPGTTTLARVVDAPAAYVSGAPKDGRRAAVKRVFDVAVAAVGGLLCLPAMLTIALLIRLDSPGPVFFRQKRHGFNNEIIRVWKFRTMRPDRLAEDGVIVQVLPNDPRVTRIGRFLRRSSLDELPQLLNVLKGEMSIVGPRPHAVGMTASAIEATRSVFDYAHRHRMKPGLTGWAQVNGSRGPCHTQEEIRKRVALDMDYVNRASIWLDAWIVVLTLPRLLGDRRKPR